MIFKHFELPTKAFHFYNAKANLLACAQCDNSVRLSNSNGVMA